MRIKLWPLENLLGVWDISSFIFRSLLLFLLIQPLFAKKYELVRSLEIRAFIDTSLVVNKDDQIVLIAHPQNDSLLLVHQNGNLISINSIKIMDSLSLRPIPVNRDLPVYQGILNYLDSIDKKKILSWGAWPESFELGMNLEYLDNSKQDLNVDLGFMWRRRYENFFYGIGYEYTSCNGSTINQFNYYIREIDNGTSFGTENVIYPEYFSAHSFLFEVGFPLVRFRFFQSANPKSVHSWLEKQPAELMSTRTAGETVVYFESDSYKNLEGNWGASLEFQLLFLHYQIDMDDAKYKSSIHIFSLQNLQLGDWSTWEMGMLLADAGTYPFFKVNFSTHPLLQFLQVGEKLTPKLVNSFGFWWGDKSHFKIEYGIKLSFRDPYDYFRKN